MVHTDFLEPILLREYLIQAPAIWRLEFNRDLWLISLKKILPNYRYIPMSNGNKKVTNVFEAILEYGHDEDFVPYENEQFMATDAPAGSDEKIEALRRRVLEGQPLWHGEDREDYSGLTGAVRPRE
jgi:hypothetical protein|tara:strand:- start:309 stop:686 length:378 start_codon:yes stop_codon:yes gene_type:complete